MTSESLPLLALVALIPFIALGVGWLIGRRRAHALELELAAARAEIKSAAEIAHEREQSLELALAQLRAGFDSVAGDALRDNSEVFLQTTIFSDMCGILGKGNQQSAISFMNENNWLYYPSESIVIAPI